MAEDLSAEIETVLDILEHARKNDGRLPGDAGSFARRLERLNKLIQKSPRLQLIRPATIALHNLAMTLGDGYEDEGLFLEDIEATALSSCGIQRKEAKVARRVCNRARNWKKRVRNWRTIDSFCA